MAKTTDTKKISHSSWQKYLQCPHMHNLHYGKKLRPVKMSSALYFGIAVDEALNVLLLGKGDALKTFKDKFKFEDLGDCEFDARDFDKEIFTQDQLNNLKSTPGYKEWASLRIKGRMMIEAYTEKVMPLVEEVKEVQMELTDRPGIIDLVAKIKGYGWCIIDNKTAGMPYRPDAVKYSTQLALYSESAGYPMAGFIVLNKQISKNRVKICQKCGFDGSFTKHKTCPQTKDGPRCHGTWDETISPEVKIQIIIDKVPTNIKQLTVDSITQVENAIKSKVFPKNLNSCAKMYGKPCPYFRYCWGGSEDGLITKEKK